MAESPVPHSESGDDLAFMLRSKPCVIVGQGRMGSALAASLRRAGVDVRGPVGRGADGAGASLVLLCVPDREIAHASAMIVGDTVVAHVSASSDLAVLAPHECASMHPLLSVSTASAEFDGATCAVDGSSARAVAMVEAMAVRLGMHPVRVSAGRRAVYHAAASAAANYSITVLAMAERLASEAGLEAEALVPLVRSTMRNWEELGAREALTGPIARGDVETAALQRASVSAHTPELLPLWDALAEGTRRLAQSRPAPVPSPSDRP